MKAARFYDNKDIRIEDIDEPTAGAGEVLIKVAWCGICGTDLHEYLDGPIFCPTHSTRLLY
ncbi:alcohol dehydrogenase catalytic domain-containing protein, partial [Rothia nasimurium]|uniref:alcohol dehydrogenase catalytic domain-containing protein n=1 Tax=Rothia nasimurium TaxID=85336 RepID=UPI001F20206E